MFLTTNQLLRGEPEFLQQATQGGCIGWRPQILNDLRLDTVLP